MSGEAALTKVKDRTVAWLDGNVSGVSIVKDRPIDKPFRDSDLPVIHLRITQVQITSARNPTGDFHDAAVMFDILAPSILMGSIDDRQAEIMADIVARLGAIDATPGTLGELLEICEPTIAASREDEMAMLSDFGVTTLAYRMGWRCPHNDFRTIAGHNGTVP